VGLFGAIPFTAETSNVQYRPTPYYGKTQNHETHLQ